MHKACGAANLRLDLLWIKTLQALELHFIARVGAFKMRSRCAPTYPTCLADCGLTDASGSPLHMPCRTWPWGFSDDAGGRNGFFQSTFFARPLRARPASCSDARCSGRHHSQLLLVKGTSPSGTSRRTAVAEGACQSANACHTCRRLANTFPSLNMLATTSTQA